MQIAAQTDIVLMMQEVSGAVQTQGHKGAVHKSSNEYCYTNTGSDSNLNNSNTFTLMVKNDIKCFLPGPSQESDRRASAEKGQLQRDFEDVFNGIGCFDGMFLLQVKPDCRHTKCPLGK